MWLNPVNEDHMLVTARSKAWQGDDPASYWNTIDRSSMIFPVSTSYTGPGGQKSTESVADVTSTIADRSRPDYSASLVPTGVPIQVLS